VHEGKASAGGGDVSAETSPPVPWWVRLGAPADPVTAWSSAWVMQSCDAQRADALALLAENGLARELSPLPGGERYQVMVHVDAGVLADGRAGRSELERGPWLCAETARRLACDASVVAVVDGENGEPLNLGRRQRTVPPAIARALRVRDGGCRFPSCNRRRFVDAHHVRHWAHGGETGLSNLVLLCGFHHRLVHEGGFAVEARAGGELVFRRPDGQVLPPAPALPGAEADELARANEAAGVEVDEHTCASLWDGVAMDYHMAMDELLQRAGRL